MEESNEIEDLNDCLDDLTYSLDTFYNILRKLKCKKADKLLLEKTEQYAKMGTDKDGKLKAAYETFSSQMSDACTKYLSELESIEQEDLTSLNGLKSVIMMITHEIEEKNKSISNSGYSKKDVKFIYNDNKISKMNADMVVKYPGSYIYNEFMSDRRTADGEVFIDCDSKNDELIVKYMNDDESLEEDIEMLSDEEKKALIMHLSWLLLPIKDTFVNKLAYDTDNKVMDAWRNRVIVVNNKNDPDMNREMKRNKTFDTICNKASVSQMNYNKNDGNISIDPNMNLTYFDVVQSYLKDKILDEKVLSGYKDSRTYEQLEADFKQVGINLNSSEKKRIKNYFLQPSLFLPDSHIVDVDYDSSLQAWLGTKYSWKLAFRASDHGYSGSSFHSYCDNVKGPTLIVIKSSGGWIFGGYTTQSWSGSILLLYAIIYIDR